MHSPAFLLRGRPRGILLLSLLITAATALGVAVSPQETAVSTTYFSSSAASVQPALCFEACQSALYPVVFDDTNPDELGLARTCGSMRALTSLYLCVDLYCPPSARDVGFPMLNASCWNNQEREDPIPGFDLISNWTAADVKRLRRVSLNDTQDAHPPILTEVVLPSPHLFGVWLDTLDAVAYVGHYHLVYGTAMGVFWAVVVAIGMLNHAAVSAASSLDPLRRRLSSAKGLGAVSELASWARSYVAVPATFGTRCAQPLGSWGTVPPRIQSLTLAAFLLINVIFGAIGYRFIPENMYFTTPLLQVLRYVSDRTGTIAFANFPLIWLFGMRNNLLMWLTGWDFGTYNNFHRWVARIATFQAVVHSVGYTWLVIEEGGWSAFLDWWTYLFWWTGEVATIVMSLLVGLSCYWLRRSHYETFLIVHILMSAALLITMLGHVSIFEGMYDFLFWIPVYIWIADRVLRILRVIAFNPRFWATRASNSYDPSSNIVRLTVPWATSLYEPGPGTYYYLHVLNGPRFWESHPFTVASIQGPGPSPDKDPESSAKLLGEQSPLLEPPSDTEIDPENTTETQAFMESTDNEGDHLSSVYNDKACSMTFLIRPYDGFTSRLRFAATTSSSSQPTPNSPSLRVLVDGPYGHTQPWHLFDSVVFLVGGSGIVVPLSYLPTLTGARRPRASASALPRSVRIHWAVREPALALDVLRTEMRDAALNAPNLSVHIHLTASTHEFPSAADWPPQASLRAGRLDAPSTIIDARERADGGSLAVIACGPAQMADSARETVAQMLQRGYTRIEYFEESFQW